MPLPPRTRAYSGLHEAVRVPEGLVLLLLPLRDPAAANRAQERPEHPHAPLELPAFLPSLVKPQEAHGDGDERDGVQSQELSQVGRLRDDVP